MMRSLKNSIASLVRRLVDKRADTLAVSLPGTVESYDASSKTAVVRPGVHRLVPSMTDADLDELEELPAVRVPVAWPRARGYSMVGTLSAGDPVLLICQDRDISGWRRSGKPSEPDDARTHVWA